MRKISKIILKYYLKLLAKLALLLHKPKIIVITGSANQFFVKESVEKELLSLNIDSKANPKNFNTEIGLPLSILDLPSGYNSVLNWIPAIKQAPFAIFKKMPKFIILSLGISNPGDMKYLMSIIKPDIAIITEINQRYLEGFENMDALVSEYEYLIKDIKDDGILIYNNDNERARSLKNSKHPGIKNSVNSISFGEREDSDWRITEKRKTLEGVNFKINTKQKTKDINLKYFGQHHIYSKTISIIVSDYVIRNKKI